MTQIRVLGPIEVEVEVGGAGESIGPSAVERLVALLVATGDDGISIERAAEQLWGHPDHRPQDPGRTIRTYLSRLRGRIGSEAVVVSTGVMRLVDVTTDAMRFEELIRRARIQGDAETWEAAVSMWRGRAFGGHDDLDDVAPVATRLHELRGEAMEAWFAARIDAGERREVVADLGTAIEGYPLREALRAQRMTALAGAGRQADAMREFQRFRAELTEIGLEPSPELVQLERDIAMGKAERHPGSPSGPRRDYRFEERLGEGAFSIVFRAEQTSLERDVAVKQIRAELANRPEFIRLFEAEAHLVASLEHPHIVPLYDYWREPGSAYLVMRYLRAGSLASRLLERPMSPAEVAGVTIQVGDALDEAHRRGIVHRDIKPDNVLLDDDGRAYLTDFGIAVDEAAAADPEAWLSNGSPAYASPEQLRRDPVGAASDIYGLGVMAYEALTQQLPFPDETTMAGLLQRQLHEPIPLVAAVRGHTPPGVDRAIQRATAKDANARHSSAGAFARELAEAVGLSVTAPTEAEPRNPYKGLLAFDEHDADDFVGRDRLVDQLVGAIETHSVVTAVGPSGSGKSSAVRAGLIPAIREGRIPGSSKWWVTMMTPGVAPIDRLAEALARVSTEVDPDLARGLGNHPRRLAETLRTLVPDDRQLVLVIDQLEELFTLADSADRTRFLAMVRHAVTAEKARLRIVQTLRADFYDHPLRDPDYARLIEPGTVPVHPLAADELERAITLPARRVGARFEPGLVARIVADVGDQPGALPLLQHTLTSLYDERVEETLTLSSYERLGGVAGSLAAQSDELYLQADPSSQAAIRSLFRRLVSPGEGTADTRRRVRRSELGTNPATTDAIDRFGSARLLAFDREPASRQPTIEVAHEALIREWPRLRGWIDDDRDGLRTLRHLSDSSRDWVARGREEGDLYRGARLEAASEWAVEHRGELSVDEAAFLDASIARRDAEATRERRQLAKLRRSLAAVGAVAVIALIAGTLAWTQRQRANDQADQAQQAATEAEQARADEADRRAEAEQSSLVSRAIAEATNRPTVGLLLAAEAYRRDPQNASQTALLAALNEVGDLKASIATSTGQTDGSEGRCQYEAGPGRLVFPTHDGVAVADMVDLTVRQLGLQTPCPSDMSGDGRLVAAPQRNGEFHVWDAERDEIVAESSGLGGVVEVAFGPDGTQLLVGTGSRPDLGISERLIIADPASGEVVEEVPLARPVQRFDWGPDGSVFLLYLPPDPAGPPLLELVVRDGPSGTEIARVDGVAIDVPEWRWLTGPDRLWTGDLDFNQRTIDLATGTVETELTFRPDEQRYAAAFTPDGARMLTSLESGSYVTDTTTGALIAGPIEQDQPVIAASFIDPDTVATITTGGSLRVVDLAGEGGLVEASISCCHDNAFVGWASVDASTLSVRTETGFRLIDMESGEIRDFTFDEFGLDPRGVLGAVTVSEGRVQILNRDLSGVTIDGSGDVLDEVDYFPNRDGALLSLARHGTLMMFLVADLAVPDPTGTAPGRPEFVIADLATGAVIESSHAYDVNSPDVAQSWLPLRGGGAILISGDGTITRHAADGAVETELATAPGTRFVSSLDPAGRLAAMQLGDQTLAVLDGERLEIVATLPEVSFARWILFVDGGTKLVATDASSRHLLIDLATGDSIGWLLGDQRHWVAGATTPSADGDGIWLTAGDRLVLVSLDPADWAARACELAGRDLTEVEWNELVPGDEPWQPVCD